MFYKTKFMKKVILLFLSICIVSNIDAQSIERINVPFKKFGDDLKYALVGGLNTPQFSEVDLNNDGTQDMYIFDRTGNVSLTFINNGTSDEPDYDYAPEHQSYFPELTDWAMLRDYNGDGVMDIFASSEDSDLSVQGIIVFTGSYVDNHLNFERFHFISQDFDLDVIPFKNNGGFEEVYVSFIDYPSIDDIDGDGDLDILTFAAGGGHVYLYNNQSIEMGYGKDSLIFNLEDECWGRFYESGLDPIIELSSDVDSCVNEFVENVAENRHAGSTLLTLDNDNDGDKELVLGDLSLPNLNMLYNGGNNEFAFMVDQDTFSPKNTLPVDINFPASFLMDVDNDSKKDLLVSPNFDNEDYNVAWFYKNTNSNEFPSFYIIQKDFLVEHMVDMGTDTHPVFFDYNADGLLDLVVGNNSFQMPFGEKVPRIYLFENKGTTSSPEFDLVDDDYLDYSQIAGDLNYAPSPTFGDLDNDGDLDLLIGEKSGKFYYVENNSGPGNPASFDEFYPEGSMGPDDDGYMGIDVGQRAVPQIVDLDRDGLPDIIVGVHLGFVSYYPNVGTANAPLFLPNIDPDIPTGENIKVLGLIDTKFNDFQGFAAPVILDFGGDYHIFSGSRAGYLLHYSNIDGNIDGDFTLETDFYGEIREGFNTHPAIADIDNDGILEMVVGNERGGLSMFKTNLITVSTNYIYQNPEVSIFPNPANDFFNVELKNGNGVRVIFSVFNAIGQEVFKDSFASSSYQVNCKSLSNGIYFVKFKIGEEVVVKKVVLGK